jgi:maleylpyruvate isomerase
MNPNSQTPARAAVRKRLGARARYDAPQAPAEELAWARLGTAYFARLLSQLTDTDLDAPSLLPGWSRRHLVAHVGYNARALTRLIEWARTGVETPMYASPEHRQAEIDRGATLPPQALRSLFAHTAVHLDMEWRELSGPSWNAQVRTAQGRLVGAHETAWMRVREVWMHGIDLDNGGSTHDFPPDLSEELLNDVIQAWQRREEPVDLLLTPYGMKPIVLGPGTFTVSGSVPDLLRWVTGRGHRRVTNSGTGQSPRLPPWF